MTAQVRVKLIWTEAKLHHLPDSLEYITLARFPNTPSDSNDDAWSIVIDFDSNETAKSATSFARARFLMPDAPSNRLIPGTKFELYEGFKKTADVLVC